MDPGLAILIIIIAVGFMLYKLSDKIVPPATPYKPPPLQPIVRYNTPLNSGTYNNGKADDDKDFETRWTRYKARMEEQEKERERIRRQHYQPCFFGEVGGEYVDNLNSYETKSKERDLLALSEEQKEKNDNLP